MMKSQFEPNNCIFISWIDDEKKFYMLLKTSLYWLNQNPFLQQNQNIICKYLWEKIDLHILEYWSTHFNTHKSENPSRTSKTRIYQWILWNGRITFDELETLELHRKGLNQKWHLQIILDSIWLYAWNENPRTPSKGFEIETLELHGNGLILQLIMG